VKGLVVILALWAVPALAQKVPCTNPVTQADMNECAALDWEIADAELNAAYAQAIATARDMNAYSQVNVEESLREAQRAWVTFRDLACEVESLVAEGGSMQPMIYSACLTTLTEERTDALRYFGGFDQ
jgi:uncharacterized protein YecT (DUF1311 family)